MSQQPSALNGLKSALIEQYGEAGYYALLSRSSVFKRIYRGDTLAFAHDCINWREGEGLTRYQEEILAETDISPKVAVQSLHGIGKTTTMAIKTLQYSLTRDKEDWKLIATASAWRQLEKYYMPEVHKWARRLNWGKIGRTSFDERTELQKLSLSLETGAASCVASDNPALIEGAHADNIAYLYDEAKIIPAATFDASNGAFSGAGASGQEALALAASTPGEPVGRFYDICRRSRGLESWKVYRIKVEDAIRAGRVSPLWVEEMRRLWGEESAVFKNKVLGEFAAQDETAVVPLSWVELANERYEALTGAGGKIPADRLPPLTGVGVDVSDGGGDLTVLARRYGNIIIIKPEVDAWVGKPQEQIETARKVAAILNLSKPGASPKDIDAKAVVDAIGVGSGVSSALAAWGYPTAPFIASAKTDVKDTSGKIGFLNLRALAYWNMRELLNPETGSPIALPPIPELTADLTTPTWQEVAGAKIKIESKEDIRARQDGRSTDYGDAVCMVFLAERLGKKRAQSW